MSLRSQIHDAIDDVATPAPTLERQVKAFVLADAATRKDLRSRPRPNWAMRLRGPLALIAAALVVMLIGGLVLGGRLLREGSVSPAPAIDHSVLSKLEARPLQAWPPVLPTGECPVGPFSTSFLGVPAIGEGAVRSVSGPDVYTSTWGTWNSLWFSVDPTASGLFLVRARDLQSRDTVFFAGNLSGVPDASFGRAILAGEAAGTIRVNGQETALRPELVINASAPSDAPKSATAPVWGAYVGDSAVGSGCVVFQIDHLGSNPETFTRKM